MRRLASALLIVAAAALCSLPAGAQVEMPHSVVGCGGGEMSGASNTVLGTVGQTVIGVAGGASNINEIGFWYMPGWYLTGIEEPEGTVPTQFRFDQNCPNPFNPVTTIQFAVPKTCHVTLMLYDVRGREVRTLKDEEMDPGFYNVVLDAAGLPSGVYFCRMAAEGFIETKKLVLLK